MTADLEIVTRWFQKAIDTATKQGRNESALLWSDGLDHLISMNDRAEKAEARVAELEAELVAQWKWDDGSILRKRRIEKLIPAETLNA